MEDRLRKFASLVDAGSFTKAAGVSHISQPALSASIAKLERELHASLLVRGTRSLQLTPAGAIAYQHAKQLAVHGRNLTMQLAQLAQAPLPLNIGMIDSVASAFFSSAEPIQQLEQHAHISVDVNNSRYLVQAVTSGALEVAFVAKPVQPIATTLLAEDVGSEPLLLVCHQARAQELSRDIARGALPHFISYDHASTTQTLITQHLQARAIVPTTDFFSTSPEVMLRLVLLQKGAAVLPYLLVKDLLEDGTLRALGTKKPLVVGRPIIRVTPRGQHISEPLAQVTSHAHVLLKNYSEAALRIVRST